MIDERLLIEELSKNRIFEKITVGEETVYDIINRLPKVGEWIPCSERMPRDAAIHEVTVLSSNGTTYTEFAYYDESREEWWKFDDDGMVNVIAWKEHSEPYKDDMRNKVE